MKDKSRRRAAILSLLWNGLGQVYLGNRMKGYILMALSGFGIIATVWGALLIIKPILQEFQKGTLSYLFSDHTTNLILGGFLILIGAFLIGGLGYYSIMDARRAFKK